MNVLHNMSCPPRTKVELLGRPVAARVVIFSLMRALRAMDLLKAAGCHRPMGLMDPSFIDCAGWARVAVLKQWKTPGDLFASIGAPTFLDVAADFVIGWRPQSQHLRLPFVFCNDPRLCAGVHAQCAGTVYLSRRKPDLTWERLLDAPVAFDDPLVTLP